MPTEISELFDRDPLLHSEQDIATIVAYQREHQAKHELGAKPGPAAPRPKKPGKAQELLKDLGLITSGDLLKDLGLK